MTKKTDKKILSVPSKPEPKPSGLTDTKTIPIESNFRVESSLPPPFPSGRQAPSMNTQGHGDSGENIFSVGGKLKKSVESTLKQSEYLKIAQNKIHALEEELDKLRANFDALSGASQTYKRATEDYALKLNNLQQKFNESSKTYKQEIALLKQMNLAKDKKNDLQKKEVENLKEKLNSDFGGIKKREKDLEHRLEIAKMEEAAIVRSKDQLILELKRQLDRTNHESENFRKKSIENYQELQDKNQMVRGVVRALRIALTKMEGNEGFREFDVDQGDGEEAGDEQAS